MEFAAIDFETANEKRDSACAIGIAMVKDGRLSQTYYHLLKPHEIRFESWNTRIHGITAAHVADSPGLTTLWPEIYGLLSGQILIAHNAAFDMSVLRHSLHANGIPFPYFQYFCSLKAAQRAWPTLLSYTLCFLADVHHIRLEHHHAESDAVAAANLILLAAKEYGCECLQSLAESLGITCGTIHEDATWTPSSAPTRRSSRSDLRIEFPEHYDLSRHPLYRKNVVFTGKLDICGRDEAHALVEVLGGFPKTSVTRDTDYVVTGVQDMRMLANGESESSKLRKAKELKKKGCKIQIISNDDFRDLIFEPSGSES